MYFLQYSHLLFWIMHNLCLGFWKLGWISFSSEYFSKSLIGLCPICYLCICVGPLWQFDHVLRHFSICSCIFHNCCALLHIMCLTDCLSDSSVLFWTQLSSNLWCWSCLIIWIIFWSSCVCFTHFVQFVPQCHAMHTLGTPRHILMHQHMHYHALAHAPTCTHMHIYLSSCIVSLCS